MKGPGGEGGGEPKPGELPRLPPQAQQEMGCLWEGKWGGGGGHDCGMWEWADPPLLSTELHRRPRREGPGSQLHLIHQALKDLGDHGGQTLAPPPFVSIWGN